MSRHERFNTRSSAYSRWHRFFLGDREPMIDIDGLEYCQVVGCWQPLVLLETARDTGQETKNSRVLRALAARCDIYALCVLYTLDPAASEHGCGCTPELPETGCPHGIASFRVQRVYPPPRQDGWKIMTPGEFRDGLRVVRREHMATAHPGALGMSTPPPATNRSAGCGMAWQGRPGTAGRGEAGQGLAGLGRLGTARRGSAGYGEAWRGRRNGDTKGDPSWTNCCTGRAWSRPAATGCVGNAAPPTPHRKPCWPSKGSSWPATTLSRHRRSGCRPASPPRRSRSVPCVAMIGRPAMKYWYEIEPRDAVDIRLPHPDIVGPLTMDGQVCPWPWDPPQLAGAPIGQYHCPYCGDMCMAGWPHTDYTGDDDGPVP